MTVSASVDPCELEATLGHRFRNKDLLQNALTHKSFAYESGGNPHNESMEFLGDSILGFLITDFIFHEFPEFSEGRKSKLPAAVEELEETLVRHALENSHRRVEEAARLLGVSRKGLFLKRRRWRLRQAS